MAEFRFYEELNDFLPRAKRKQTLRYEFRGRPGIKDSIESFGVPHTEVDLILVNGAPVDFGYPLGSGDRVAVYPMFECFDITPLMKLRDRPLRNTVFVADVNLGKLARRLRILGFDVLYHNRYRDDEIADIAAAEHRIVLTRDRRLLFIKRITHGYWVRSVNPEDQVREVLARFDLSRQVRPFRRCIDCNGPLRPVAKAEVFDRLEPKTKRYYENFLRCEICDKVYWEGSHVEDMRKRYIDPVHATGPAGPLNERTGETPIADRQ